MIEEKGTETLFSLMDAAQEASLTVTVILKKIDDMTVTEFIEQVMQPSGLRFCFEEPTASTPEPVDHEVNGKTPDGEGDRWVIQIRKAKGARYLTPNGAWRKDPKDGAWFKTNIRAAEHACEYQGLPGWTKPEVVKLEG